MLGLNNTSIGKTSSLPISISIVITSFDKIENSEKFPVGPTLPKPGPILLIVATIAVNVVAGSKPSSETISVETTKSNKNAEAADGYRKGRLR